MTLTQLYNQYHNFLIDPALNARLPEVRKGLLCRIDQLCLQIYIKQGKTFEIAKLNHSAEIYKIKTQIKK